MPWERRAATKEAKKNKIPADFFRESAGGPRLTGRGVMAGTDGGERARMEADGAQPPRQSSGAGAFEEISAHLFSAVALFGRGEADGDDGLCSCRGQRA